MTCHNLFNQCDPVVDHNARNVAQSAASESTSDEYYDIEGQQEAVATSEILAQEQNACPSLKECWRFADKRKGNIFIENGLLYHYDTVFGHRIKLVPECCRNIVMKFANDPPFAGYMALQRISVRNFAVS